MTFPRIMNSVKSEQLVVKFTSEQSGVVVVADDRYPIGFESETWETALNKDTWEPANMMEHTEPKKIDIGSKYHKSVPGSVIDVYDVLVAFDVTNPATQHAIKKLLMPGSRGHKNVLTDLEEAHNSIKRAIQIEKNEPIKGA